MARLEGERIVLREWRADEVGAMHRWLGNPEVTRFLSWGSQTLADSARHLSECLEAQRQDERKRYFLAIEVRQDGRVVGDAGFEWSSETGDLREGRLGYFVEPEYWGRGFATEAATLLLDFAFGKLGAIAMRASCDARNLASERVMQKCGMQRELVCEFVGRRAYRITREEWNRRIAQAEG
jgi:RimJ/RimL family protein N-acetyltransferase